MIPPALNRVVKTCLAKDPEDRFQTAHDVKLQLEWIAEGGSQAGLPAPVVARRKNREKLAWAVAAVAASSRRRSRRSATCAARRSRRAVVRFEIATPAEVIVDRRAAHLSRRTDCSRSTRPTRRGRRRSGSGRSNALAAQPLRGNRGNARVPSGRRTAGSSASSPTGSSRRSTSPAGRRTKICDAPTGSDGTWSPEGVILFDGTGTDPIQRVSAAGGTPVVAVKPEPRARRRRSAGPSFCPTAATSSTWRSTQKADDSAYRIGSLDSKETKAFAPAQTMLTYAPPGYLLFVRDRTLVAQPFDAKALKTTGRAGSPGGADRDRRGRARALLGLARRRARLPHRGVGKPAALDGPLREGARERSATRASTRIRPSRPAATASRSI